MQIHPALFLAALVLSMFGASKLVQHLEASHPSGGIWALLSVVVIGAACALIGHFDGGALIVLILFGFYLWK